MRIPMLDLKAQHEGIASEVEAAVRQVLDSQQFILGPEVKALEREIAAYCDCEHAIGCASGSDALLLALMALGVGPGDEVITTPFTFFATAGAIVRLGARPVFVDIEETSFNIDAGLIEKAVTGRTKAILPVHLFGQCADMDVIGELAKKHGFAILEDAAQAIGAEFMGKRAGSLGDVAAFSFYPSKNLGGAGDGGMLTTNAPDLAGKLRYYRVHGAKNKYFHDVVGINSRLDTLQAAILLVKLRHLEDWSQARRANAARYREYFEGSGLIGKELVKLSNEEAGRYHVYNQFVIRVRERDRLKSYLAENGVGTEIYYPLPLHLQVCFQNLGYKEGDFPIAERAAQEALALPIYPELSAAAQEHIVSLITDYFS
ncbi:MAG TPA: DegT/DnrJ/EryC1/StrS family aminotransferase [Blastocatellia bacterium]|nr:DegT/DnrJ/EryC1/StrS family aminotransferase [Blastocatellia bacterium]